MRRVVIVSVLATGLAASLAGPSFAGQPRTTVWACDVPGEGRVEFVTAAEAARHGITQANSHAGVVFLNRFGEVCTVE